MTVEGLIQLCTPYEKVKLFFKNQHFEALLPCNTILFLVTVRQKQMTQGNGPGGGGGNGPQSGGLKSAKTTTK